MKQQSSYRSIFHDQSGSMTLFIAVIVIPLLLFLFSAALDTSRYFALQQEAQRTSDAAALLAYQSLPDRKNAKMVAASYMKSSGGMGDAQIESTSSLGDFVDVSFRKDLPLLFSTFFHPLTLPVMSYSRARGTPVDLFLAIDVSSYMAPPVGQSWTDSILRSPAVLFENSALLDRGLRGKTSPALSATQRCFNPIFSQVKQTAIALWDSFSAFQENGLGLGFFPGTVRIEADSDGYRGDLYLDVARRVETPRQRTASGGLGEVWFTDYQGEYGRDSWCGYAAQVEDRYPEWYGFPFHSKSLPALVSPPPGKEMFLSENYGDYHAAHQPYLRGRDLIWMHAASEGVNQSTPEVIEAAYRRILEADSPVSRGGLQSRVYRQIVVLAGDVPHAQEYRFPDERVKAALREKVLFLSHIKNQQQGYLGTVRVTYVLFSHLEMDTKNVVESLSHFFSSLESEQDAVKFRVLYAGSKASLVQQLGVQLQMDGKTALISRRKRIEEESS